MSNKVSLMHYACAGYPAVAISTADEDRAIASVLSTFDKRKVFRIAATGGLLDARTNAAIEEKANYATALSRVSNLPESVLIVLDFQHSIKTPQWYRILRDTLPLVKHERMRSLIVLIAPNWQLPAELEHDIPVINDAMPTREELSDALQTCTTATDTKLDTRTRNALLDSASGLTLAEAENAFSLSYASSGKFDAVTVSDEKMKLVRQSGVAEISKPADPSELGGLQAFQDCAEFEILPSIDDPLVAASGVILDGVPGTGKSLAIRVLSAKLGWPIMRVDMASLKARSGGIVGQSESGLLTVFKIARAIAPVILFFDEAEKGFAGSSTNNDSGVSSGMLGIYLTQTQEIRDANEKVFVAFTTNDYQLLPAPVTRRLELKFFVDIPTRREREDIAAKKLAKYAPGAISLASKIADMTIDFTGAEIEDLIRSAARRTRRNVTEESLVEASHDIRPIAKTRADEISRLREWGRSNLRLANTPETVPVHEKKTGKRKLGIIDTLVAETLTGGNA